MQTWWWQRTSFWSPSVGFCWLRSGYSGSPGIRQECSDVSHSSISKCNKTISHTMDPNRTKTCWPIESRYFPITSTATSRCKSNEYTKNMTLRFHQFIRRIKNVAKKQLTFLLLLSSGLSWNTNSHGKFIASAKPHIIITANLCCLLSWRWRNRWIFNWDWERTLEKP